jgi:hypothetical protein
MSVTPGARLHRPYGTASLITRLFPALKRGANIHCAYGAGTVRCQQPIYAECAG